MLTHTKRLSGLQRPGTQIWLSQAYCSYHWGPFSPPVPTCLQHTGLPRAPASAGHLGPPLKAPQPPPSSYNPRHRTAPLYSPAATPLRGKPPPLPTKPGPKPLTKYVCPRFPAEGRPHPSPRRETEPSGLGSVLARSSQSIIGSEGGRRHRQETSRKSKVYPRTAAQPQIDSPVLHFLPGYGTPGTRPFRGRPTSSDLFYLVTSFFFFF